MSISKHSLQPWLMWLLPLTFFAYQFILRLWPGLMMNNIMLQFHIDAQDFGLLAAFYYYGYAGMQIPTAILLDKYGARSIVSIFAVICGLSMLCMTYTSNFHLALACRFFIGVGSAVGFLGVSKVISEWFPTSQYAHMVGLSFTFGLMGAIYGGKPTHMCIETYGWESVSVVLSFIAMAIGAFTYCFVRSPISKMPASDNETSKLSSSIFSSPYMWMLALANLLMVGTLEGFADVWGVPYLMTAYGINKGNAAALISCIFFGMLFGGPFLAWCAKRWGNYTMIALCGLGMASAYVVLFAHLDCHTWLLAAVFFVVGVLCCYQVIVFAAGADWVSPQQLGMTVAFLNGINMLGGSFFHTLIGRIMDTYWTGSFGTESVRLYDISSFVSALSIIPACALMGAIIVWWIGMALKRKNLAS